MGRPAAKSWGKCPLRRLFLAGPGPRARGQQAYADSLLEEADNALHCVEADTGAFREQISRHFTKAGARR